MAREVGPHRICRAGRHCLALTGVTPDNRCLACRRESHRRAQRRFYRTAKGQLISIADNRRQRSS